MAGTEVETKTTTTNVQLADPKHAAQLMDGYAGFVNDQTSTAEERMVRLAGLAPVAMQVMSEARDTVEHLREELDEVKRPKLITGSDYQSKVLEIQHNTLVDLHRQWRAVHQRVDLTEFAEEVFDIFGPQVSSAFMAYAAQQHKDANTPT